MLRVLVRAVVVILGVVREFTWADRRRAGTFERARLEDGECELGDRAKRSVEDQGQDYGGAESGEREGGGVL